MTGQRFSKERGFSLLEVLVAFAIMAISLSVLYRTSGGSVRAVADAEHVDRAVRTARAVLAMYEGVPEGGLSQDGVDGGFRWVLRSSPYPLDGEGASLHRVEVIVTATSDERPRTFVMATLLPQLKPQTGVR